MKIICHLCGNEFEKPDKEVRRQQKEGREYFFCSRSCTGIYANKIRHNTPEDGLKPHQRRTKKIQQLLGEKLSTAKSKLNKLLMFELAKKCNMDSCYRCGEKIDDITDFTIDHKESWLLGDDPAQLFYDMDNIAFSHARCNYEAGTKTFVSNYKNGVKEDMELYVY
ncbi:HNH endonuclease [Sporomusa malonica]|uniref:HNH endonuclease n=1 Tax=Sporomusa malonica TaxID=112901 RepID=A0A1W1YYR9_9FIRM|nr:HNH endonuclease [Sporomusa malonica]SMC41273.1 HNH endonuclease [Sporomusa malonica]